MPTTTTRRPNPERLATVLCASCRGYLGAVLPGASMFCPACRVWTEAPAGPAPATRNAR